MTPNEFNFYSEIAHYNYITNRYADFEKHQKTIDDLQFLVVLTDGVGGNPSPLALSVNTAKAGEEFFNLPIPTNDNGGRKMFLLDVQFGFSCNGEGNNVLYHDARIKHHDSHRTKNVYANPDDSRGQFYYLQLGNGIRKIGGKQLAVRAIVKYLRYPAIPTLNADGTTLREPELEKRVNSDIVEFIVSAYLEATSAPRQQTFQNENQKNFNQPTINYK
jgi:hypothetical protein